MGGIVDVVPDSSPIIGPPPTQGIFLNCGGGTGGFKAIPTGGTLLAHLLATGAHHEISRLSDLGRFAAGRSTDRRPARGSRIRRDTIGAEPTKGKSPCISP